MKPKQFCQNCWFMIREQDGVSTPCCCRPTPVELTGENLLALIRDLQRQIEELQKLISR